MKKNILPEMDRETSAGRDVNLNKSIVFRKQVVIALLLSVIIASAVSLPGVVSAILMKTNVFF